MVERLKKMYEWMNSWQFLVGSRQGLPKETCRDDSSCILNAFQLPRSSLSGKYILYLACTCNPLQNQAKLRFQRSPCLRLMIC
jgi:hypothetical protein